MNVCVEESDLTPSERQLASEHWESLMFAPSRYAVEAARLALMKAPFSVQHAVIADITAHWLQNYEPSKEENPFLDPDIAHPTTETEETDPSPQIEAEAPLLSQVEFVEAIPQTCTLSCYSLRLEQWLKQPLALNGRAASTGADALFQRAVR